MKLTGCGGTPASGPPCDGGDQKAPRKVNRGMKLSPIWRVGRGLASRCDKVVMESALVSSRGGRLGGWLAGPFAFHEREVTLSRLALLGRYLHPGLCFVSF